MPHFDVVDQGDACRYAMGAGRGLCCGPRVVRLRDELVCTYMQSSNLGINDFVPMLMRSGDGGRTWQPQGQVFPSHADRFSLFMNLSRAHSGELFLFGTRTVVERPGEPNWSEATQGLKENQLAWSRSSDGGRTWLPPRAFALPFPGSAELPGPLCVIARDRKPAAGGPAGDEAFKGISPTGAGAADAGRERWIGVYAPYNTFDPSLKVDRDQLVAVISDDAGQTWRGTVAMQFDEPDSGAAEAWIIELSDGRLLSTCWHTCVTPGAGNPPRTNKYALSTDGGETWSPTRSTGTLGHTTSLLALPGGGAVFCYVQRQADRPPGIHLAEMHPTPQNPGILADDLVWRAGRATAGGGPAEHSDWQQYTFGEPSLAVLPDGQLLLVYWYQEGDHSGIRWLRLKRGR